MIRTSLRNWGCLEKEGKYSPVMMIIRLNPISKVTTMKKVKVYINSKTITTINQNTVHLSSQIHLINPISWDPANRLFKHSSNVKKECKWCNQNEQLETCYRVLTYTIWSQVRIICLIHSYLVWVWTILLLVSNLGVEMSRLVKWALVWSGGLRIKRKLSSQEAWSWEELNLLMKLIDLLYIHLYEN